VCHTGLECLLMLAENPPEILVIDLEIPWGGGDGVLEWGREHAAADGLPQIFVTGDDSPADLSCRTGIPPGHCFQKTFRIGRC
jgi:CheY-like chemotaxis protein